MRRTPLGEKIYLTIGYSILVAWALITLFPLYWMVTTAIKPPTFVMALPPEWIPRELTFENFVEMFAKRPWVRWSVNSVIVAGGVTLFQLVTASMAGYGFSKKEFPGREFIFWLYISSMMIPGFALIIPLYQLAVKLRLRDTYLGIMMPGLSSSFGTFLMRQFIRTLPTELIDAGKIDGCGELSVFWRIVMPLALPGMAVLGIFVFMGQWGSFLWPLIVTSKDRMKVITLAVGTLGTAELRTNYGAVMAGSTYIALPMFLVFAFFSRYFLRGVTIGALKG
jgi:multiple sugar transport system permease protein